MPNPNINYDTIIWCSKHNIDVEKLDNVCTEMASIYGRCGECPCCELQAYTIVIQDETQKQFISPKSTDD